MEKEASENKIWKTICVLTPIAIIVMIVIPCLPPHPMLYALFCIAVTIFAICAMVILNAVLEAWFK